MKNKIINFLKELRRTQLWKIKNRSFSMEGEDLLLLKLLRNKPKGFYVDVGAHHPMRLSNTYLFYRMGWNGINIDAMPGLLYKFNKYRKRDINIEALVSDKNQIKRYEIYSEGAFNGISQNEFASDKGDAKLISSIEIKTRRLDEIFAQYLPKEIEIDFMSIDVEGHEFEVLKSSDWTQYRPKFLLIERHNIDIYNFKNDLICNYLHGLKYELICRTPANIFFQKIE
jgi:FkbM family methyltransferase